MSKVLMTPICTAKAYSWHAYVKGVLALDWPKDDIFWLFVVQEQGLEDELRQNIAHLQAEMGGEYRGIESVQYRLPFADAYFDPRETCLTWKERAQFAAHLRAVGFQTALTLCPDFTHLFSLGCDVCLNDPQDLQRLMAVGRPLVSGVILARLRHFPLVLSYDPATQGWEPWVDYPRDTPFIADWTGMDILLMERRLTEVIDLFQFDIDRYGVGEDGWFCLEAREKGAPTWVDPRVTPYHVHQDGTVLWADRTWEGPDWQVFCSSCGTEARGGANLRDFLIACPGCRREYVANSWWSEPVFQEASVSSSRLISAV